MNKQEGAHFHEEELEPGRDDPLSPSMDCTIGELSRESGVTLRALRFYQSKGLLAPERNGHGRLFTSIDRERLFLIQQGKRLGFTLGEIREMLASRARGDAHSLPITRKKCVEQISLLEHQRHDLDMALVELRRIYTGMFIASDVSHAGDSVGPRGHRLKSV